MGMGGGGGGNTSGTGGGIQADTSTQIKLPASVAFVQAASGNNILAGGGGSVKNRLMLLQITVDTAGTITIADFTTLKVYLPASGSFTWDFGTVGALQNTANTAITLTNSGGGNFTASVIYRAE